MTSGKLKNCVRCGKVFLYSGNRLCNECLQKEADDFQRVRDFIRENPNLPILAVAEETEVEVEQIREWIRQGRLELDPEAAGVDLRCTFCGRPITKGGICDSCADQWGPSAESTPKVNGPRKRSQVYIIDRIQGRDKS